MLERYVQLLTGFIITNVLFIKNLFFNLLLLFTLINTVEAQPCSGSWAVGTSLNYGCITGVAVGNPANPSQDPLGCPVNPVYTLGQSNTFTFSFPVESFNIDFTSFSSANGCARMEIKINDIFYPLTLANIISIPSAVGCPGSFSFITVTNDGYIASNNTSTLFSNGQARIIINGVNATSVTISTNDALGSIVSKPFNCIPVVPLKLLSFNGQSNLCKAQLNWETGIEQNVSYIEIQRSQNTIGFTKIGEVIPKGSNSSYSFTCDNTTNGYFRLKIIDLDGYFEYSNIINIKSNCTNITYQVVPNPTSNSIEILGLKGNDKVFVIDMLGRRALTFQSSLGNNKFDIQKLASGMYVLQIINNGMIKFNTKLIKD